MAARGPVEKAKHWLKGWKVKWEARRGRRSRGDDSGAVDFAKSQNLFLIYYRCKRPSHIASFCNQRNGQRGAVVLADTLLME